MKDITARIIGLVFVLLSYFVFKGESEIYKLIGMLPLSLGITLVIGGLKVYNRVAKVFKKIEGVLNDYLDF